MVRPLAGHQDVWVVWLKRKIRSSILKSKAASSWDDTGSEAHIVAVNKGARIAHAVDDAEVHRVTAGTRGARRTCVQGIDLASAEIRMLRREKALHGHINKCGISHVPGSKK